MSVRFSCETLPLTLPQVTDFVPTGYPGLTNRPKWQRMKPKTSCSTKFRHDSEYIQTPPPGRCGEVSPLHSALENFNMAGKVLLTCV